MAWLRFSGDPWDGAMAAMALLGHLDADSRVNQRDLGAMAIQ